MSIAEQILNEARERKLPLDKNPELARQLKCLAFLQEIPDSLCQIVSETYRNISRKDAIFLNRGANA